jgi:hypothetical protein
MRKALTGNGALRDFTFDRLYPLDVRRVSSRFWTPVRVARRAAELLAASPSSRILDVGSGAGKFCIVGALHTKAHFTGFEQRENLVTVARRTANVLRAVRTDFVHATIDAIPWDAFDGFYFFNPFLENPFGLVGRLDGAVELSRERLRRDLRVAFDGLRRAKPGARVVTYHGIGTMLPDAYRFAAREKAGSDTLDLWINDGEGDSMDRPPLEWP